MKKLLMRVFFNLADQRRFSFGRFMYGVLEADAASRQISDCKPVGRYEITSQKRVRTSCHSQITAGVAVFCITAIASVSRAEPIVGEMQIRPELHAASISKYERRNGISDNYDIAAITAELTVYSAARPYFGGLFIDYRFATHDVHDASRNLGGYFRYNFSRWDATTWLFVNQPKGNSGTWLYATRLRYRLWNGHKLGIEALAPIDDAGAPELMLGYYASIASRLSLNILVGADTNGQLDRAARLELSWQIH